MIDLRARADENDGGFARVTLRAVEATTDGGGEFEFAFDVEEVLWEGGDGLAMMDTAVFSNIVFDPGAVDLPVAAVAFLTNDGVMWTVTAVDSSGCMSALPGMEDAHGASLIGQLDVIASPDSWSRRLGVPLDPDCDVTDAPAQPGRHDVMVGIALTRMSEVRDERQELNGISELADRLGMENEASGPDIERQLFEGVAIGNLDYQPVRFINVRLPGVERDDLHKLIIVLHEGDPPVGSGWFTPNRPRTRVQLPIPRLDNAVSVYVGTLSATNPVAGFSPLPQPWGCGDVFAGIEPYALVPARAFHPPNETINLDRYRP